MGPAVSVYLQVFTSRRMAVMLLMGFASGLPLALTGGTLQAWMTVSGVDIRTIGIFALAGLPYTVKFLWSPVMDRFVPPWLGRRRGWLFVVQSALIAGIGSMGFVSPEGAPSLLALLALIVAFSSASQDIVVDAYRTDILQAVERGMGVAVFVAGYRIATLVSGGLALILAERIGWQNTYWLMAGIMTLCLLSTMRSPEPAAEKPPPPTLVEAVRGPLLDFFSRPAAALILLLIVLYKLGDAYAGSLTTAFLIRGAGFTLTDVGIVNKWVGLAASLIGTAAGGAVMIRIGLYRSLLLFGIFQAVSNLSFVILALTGRNYPVMICAVTLENLCGGMGTAAFVSLLMAVCNQRYSATQYALLSSLAAMGRVFISPTSGFVVGSVGWANFFLITTAAALPGLIMLRLLRGVITGLGNGAEDA